MVVNRELIVYSVLTASAWIVSLTWLFPFVALLKFSKTCRNRWFSWFYVKFCGPQLKSAMAGMRMLAFDRLRDDFKDRESNDLLEFLEIGIGGGANLRYYPENTSLTVVDMNPTFVPYFEEKRHKFPHLILKRTVITMAEDMREIDDDTFDVVICTYTLCSVENLRSVLDEIKRVLKPGGKFLSLEHVPYPSSSWNFTLQKFAAPLWNIFFNGCDLTRKTDEEIRKTGFTEVEYQRFYPKDMWLFARRHIIGLAIK